MSLLKILKNIKTIQFDKNSIFLSNQLIIINMNKIINDIL